MDKKLKRTLLIIDVQNDYFPGGAMELHGSLEAGKNISRVLDDFRSQNIPIIHIQHISTRPGAGFFLPETKGVEIWKEVSPLTNETVLQKNYPNSFRSTGLEKVLKNIGTEELIIVGMMSHMCVDTTVRAAYDLGFKNMVLDDCCATRDLKLHNKIIKAQDVHASFMAALNGLFASVQSSREY